MQFRTLLQSFRDEVNDKVCLFAEISINQDNKTFSSGKFNCLDLWCSVNDYLFFLSFSGAINSKEL